MKCFITKYFNNLDQFVHLKAIKMSVYLHYTL